MIEQCLFNFCQTPTFSVPTAHPRTFFLVPCCPQNVHISLVSTETLEITWPAVRGAELYETVAGDGSEILHCSDTMPICVLSDLTCNSLYSVVIRPCSEIRGCNNTCTPNTQETGSLILVLYLQVSPSCCN